MNQQRTLIYKERLNVLDGLDLTEKIKQMICDSVAAKVAACTEAESKADWQLAELRSAYLGLLTTPDSFKYKNEDDIPDADALTDMLTEQALQKYEEKNTLFTPAIMREVERVILLQNVDRRWMDHIDAMEELKGLVGLNSYAQRNPVVEYKIQGSIMFDEMTHDIREGTVRAILSVMPRPQPIQRVQIIQPSDTGGEPKAPIRITKKIGPNDPCPCGSGKKFKFCHGLKREGQR